MNYNCYIPSLSAEYAFEYLNFEQQQTLVSGIVTGNLENGYPIKKPVIDILKENINDKTVNIDNLTIYDYLAMLYSLRQNNFSATYESKDFLTFDMEEMLQDIRQVVVDKEIGVFTDGDFIVSYSVPTISRDLDVERIIFEKCNHIQDKEEMLRNIYKYTYLGEIVKQIKSISYKGVVTDFDSIPVEERFAYVGNIPIVLLKKVLTIFDKKYLEFVKYKTFNGNVLVVDYSFFL